jgi:hypothetical protein
MIKRKLVFLIGLFTLITLLSLFSKETIFASESDWVSIYTCHSGTAGYNGTLESDAPWYIDTVSKLAKTLRFPINLFCPINIYHPRTLSNLSSIYVDYYNPSSVDNSARVKVCARQYYHSNNVCSDWKSLNKSAGHHSTGFSGKELLRITSLSNEYYPYLEVTEQDGTKLIGYYLVWDF